MAPGKDKPEIYLSDEDPILLKPIGRVLSEYTDRQALPKQGRGQDIRATIELAPGLEPAWRDVKPGTQMWVLTWLHQAERDILRVHPQGNKSNPLKGVFSTRSPARPNPIGLSLVEVIEIKDARMEVKGLEVLNGTPVLDLKQYFPNSDT